MDFSTLFPWISTSLNTPNPADLQEWTQAELYNYAEEALHYVGGHYLFIAEFDSSTALVADQAIYPLPVPQHVATIYAAADGVALRPSTVAEMEALDDLWDEAASVAAPTRWVGDALGLGVIRIYPPKNAGGTLTLIYHKQPPALNAAAPVINMPAPVGDYVAVKTIQAARMRQGDAQMLDAAQALGALGDVYQTAFKNYWEAL